MADGVSVRGGSQFYGPPSGPAPRGNFYAPRSGPPATGTFYKPPTTNQNKGRAPLRGSSGAGRSQGSSPAPTTGRIRQGPGITAAGMNRAAAGLAGQDDGLSAFELWQLMGGGSGGGGGGGGPSRAQIQAQAAPSRARIEAMYKQYADMIAAREADITKNYTTAGQNLQSIYGGAEQNINESYNAARAAQTAQLQALGLTETAPPTNTNQQAYAASILSRLGAAGMSENDAARVAAINNNLALRNAATGEGARTLSSFDAQLANALASAGSGGGGGGGGGGGSFRDMLAAMQFDATRQENAANMAFRESQARPNVNVDWNSFYAKAIEDGLSESDAINRANAQARYAY